MRVALTYFLKLILLGSVVLRTTGLCQSPVHFESYTDGIRAYHRGELGSALKLLEQALDDLPSLQVSLALSALGEVHWETGDRNTAGRLMRDTDRAGPVSPVAHARLADYLLKDNRPEDAVRACKAAFLSGYRGASLAIVESVYAEALIALGRIPEGEAVLNKALAALAADRNRYPWEFGWALVRSARTAEARGDFKRALSQSEEAFKFSEPRWGAWSPLALASLDLYGSALARNGEVARGRAVLEKVLELRREVYLETSPSVRSTKSRLEPASTP